MKRTQHIGLLMLLVFATSLFAGLDQPLTYNNEVRPARDAYTVTVNNDSRETAATLTWLEGMVVNTNFGGWTNDYFFEYYVPAADGYISTIDFEFSDLPDVTGGGMSVWIYSMAYGWAEIATDDIADACGPSNLGYYDEATGFEVVGTNWVQGGVNDVEGANPDYNYDPLIAQAWPLFGAASIAVDPNADDVGTVTLDPVAEMGSTYEFLQGEPFAIVVRFNGFPDGGDADEYRMGFYSTTLGYDPQPSMKFYSDISSPEGRCGPATAGYNDWGWYIRSYVWDWKVNVFYTGDRGPQISDVSVLATTVSTASREVTATIIDDNPGGGDAGVGAATLYYSLDGGEFMEVAMTADGDTYSGMIPGQAPGTTVSYYVGAADVAGLATETLPINYDIFQATSKFLFLYDASTQPYSAALMWPYFYGYNVPSDSLVTWDVWDGLNYGGASLDLLNLYDFIVYPGGFYPANVPDGVTMKAWIDAGTADFPRYVFATGQDYGVVSGFADTTFPAGSFEYDNLGIMTLGPQDIVGGTTDLYDINGVVDNYVSGYLTELDGQLAYDPTQLAGTNWVDNMEAADHATVWLTDPNNGDGALATYAGDGSTWGAAYSQIDPYCMITYDAGADTVIWPNITDYVLNVFDNLFTMWNPPYVGVEDEDLYTPASFALGNAYPNPFNPSTSFEYSLAEAGNVNVTVYNALGQEVATLVDGNKAAGTYLVNWNAANMASGVYFYKLTAPGFSATNKVLLLK